MADSMETMRQRMIERHDASELVNWILERIDASTDYEYSEGVVLGEIEELAQLCMGGETDDPGTECPWCHETFYSFNNDDPLKHHMQYCENDPGFSEPEA